MAERRLIAQSITDSGQVARLIRKCGPWAGLLFSWCVPFIDDDGRMDGDPETVRAKILGQYVDQVSVADVAEMIATMNDLELVVLYEVVDSPDERYLYFPKFQVQQGLRADRYAPSRRPAPPGWQADEGHPYSRRPELLKEKPPKDRRRTRRVPKRHPHGATLPTSGVPGGNQPRTEGSHVVASPPRDDAISRPISSRLISSDLVSSPSADAGQEDDSLRRVDAGDGRGDMDLVAFAKRIGYVA